MPVDRITLPIGVTVKDSNGDHYRIEALLGKGGFGAVYLVKSRRAPYHLFALKEVIDPNTDDQERLLSECEILKRLDHRALPHVYHVFANPKLKRVYLLMDYIKGKNLEELRREQLGQRFPLDLALAILAPVVDALIYMHKQKPSIIHRDIKPANIIMPLDGGEAVLVDFGTAKEYAGDTTTRGFRHGSPGYAAIEQYGGGSGTDFRTDVYGLGATLYALVTGITPKDAIARVSGEKGNDPLKPIKALVPAFPQDISDAIERAMSVHKDDRFATLEDFWRALHSEQEEAQETEVETPAALPLPIPPQEKTTRSSITPLFKVPQLERSPRWRVLLAVVALCVIMLGGLAAFLTRSHFLTYATPSTHSTMTATHVARPTTSPTSHALGAYPSLASSYAGTASDIGVAQEKTAMILTEIQQDQGNISGGFNGLGQVGHFTGTISSSGVIQFKVPIQQGSAALAFAGTIKVGGDIAGEFYVLNQAGQRTGEYGIWYVKATS